MTDALTPVPMPTATTTPAPNEQVGLWEEVDPAVRRATLLTATHLGAGVLLAALIESFIRSEALGLISLVIAFGVMLTAITGMSWYGFVEFSRKGKARVIWMDSETRKPKISFHEIVSGNEIVVRSGDKLRRYMLASDAMHPGRYPTWFIHPRHGHNYTAPPDAETVNKDAKLHRLSISNPEMYHYAIARNRVRDAAQANKKDDKYAWVPLVVMAGGICFVALLGMVIFIVVKVAG